MQPDSTPSSGRPVSVISSAVRREADPDGSDPPDGDDANGDGENEDDPDPGEVLDMLSSGWAVCLPPSSAPQPATAVARAAATNTARTDDAIRISLGR